MNRKTKRARAPGADQSAYAPPGEQVYAGDVDKILADRIVKRTQESTGASSQSKPRSRPSKAKSGTSAPAHKGMKRALALAAVCAGIALLVVRALLGSGTHRRRRR